MEVAPLTRRITVEWPAAMLEARELTSRTMWMLKPDTAQRLSRQAAECPSFGFRLDGELLGVLYFFEHKGVDAIGRRLVEIGVAIDARAGPHLWPAVRFTQSTLVELLHNGDVTLLARVVETNKTGERLLALLG